MNHLIITVERQYIVLRMDLINLIDFSTFLLIVDQKAATHFVAIFFFILRKKQLNNRHN